MTSQRPTLSVFRLVDVAEVDALVDGEHAEIRIEVFEDTANAGQFRCRTWRLVEYGLHTTTLETDDDALDTEWEPVLVPWWVPGGFVTDEPFFASSKEAALEAMREEAQRQAATDRLNGPGATAFVADGRPGEGGAEQVSGRT